MNLFKRSKIIPVSLSIAVAGVLLVSFQNFTAMNNRLTFSPLNKNYFDKNLNPVGLNTSYKYNGVPFLAISKKAVLKLGQAQIENILNTKIEPVYRLSHLQYRLLTANNQEISLLQANGWSLEGVLFYAPVGTGVPIYRYSNQNNGDRWYSTLRTNYPDYKNDGVAFYAYENSVGEGFYFDGKKNIRLVVPVFEYVADFHFYAQQREPEYTIGAFYFGMFSAASTSLKHLSDYYFGVKQLGPMGDWWGGVRQLYERGYDWVNENYKSADSKTEMGGDKRNYNYLKPKIGYYDQNNVNVLEKHIQQAYENGISYFNFYWFWNPLDRTELYADGLKSFLQARNSEDIEFSLSLWFHAFMDDAPRSDYQLIADKLVEYFLMSNYLKIKQRPVIEIGDHRRLGDYDPDDAQANFSEYNSDGTLNSQGIARNKIATENLKEFLRILKQTSASKGLKDPYVMINGSIIYDFEKFENESDAVTCLQPVNFKDIQRNDLTIFYKKQIDALYGSSGYKIRSKKKEFIPCVATDINETPRIPIHMQQPNTATSTVAGIAGTSNTLLKKTLASIKNRMDQESGPKILQIYAWNEWHEGGIIEPNIRDGALILNSINSIFHLPQGFDPCRISGNCLGLNPQISVSTLPILTTNDYLGAIDGVYSADAWAGAGSQVITGWTCRYMDSKPLTINLFFGNNYWEGGIYFTSQVANFPSYTAEESVNIANLCQTKGASSFRFAIKLPPADIQKFKGQRIYIHIIDGYRNQLLTKSGDLKL